MQSTRRCTLTKKEKIYVRQFGSFLDNNSPLPSNQDLLAEAARQHVKLTPTTITKQLFKDVNLKLDEEDEALDKRPINRRVMFVAENSAVRTDGKGDNKTFDNFTMFHDTDRPTNTFKLYAQVNDRRLQDAYITDAIKNKSESDSQKLKAAFLIAGPKTITLANWQQHQAAAIRVLMRSYAGVGAAAATEDEAVARLTANAETFAKSACIFAQECAVIEPKQLVVFGQDAATVLRQMKPFFSGNTQLTALIDELKVVRHYATIGNFANWVATQNVELLRKLGLDPSQNQPFEPLKR
ncbi:hypothetical protein [Lacticaseibacillus thailandensis]|uniref:hypothetical protein n=1 Tax=Lacticaseibacillus thailandensis TaxID=381741 RepID=UPI000AB791F3|nr:hypothetical protein [Lacticaseibacillus thailandensis]